jgi:hypothetical protein
MRHLRTGGFTVVEVFMVVTLLAIVVGLMVVPAHRLIESLHVRPLEEVVLSAVRQAHLQARQRGEPVLLDYQSISNRLRICTLDGIFLEEVALEPTDNDTPVLVFHRLLPEDPERDEPAFEPEDDPAHAIVFDPCWASAPFAVEVMDRKNILRLVMDPFSSEPVLREEEGGEA